MDVPRKSMKPHTVRLFNFLGEINDVASYQEAVIKHCYCNVDDGVTSSTAGVTTDDTARLYIFKRDAQITASDGTPMRYLPFDEWNNLANKTGYWTLNPNGKDYFVVKGRTNRLRIKRFSDKEIGSRRMWHFEVDGI